jgi:hypothetical protein
MMLTLGISPLLLFVPSDIMKHSVCVEELLVVSLDTCIYIHINNKKLTASRTPNVSVTKSLPP